MKGTTIGSLRYDPTGRKRKTKALSSCKKYSKSFQELQSRNLNPRYTDNRNKVYKSNMNSGDLSTVQVEDSSYKLEVSKNYTVSIAYNKSGYQVVPASEVRYIGKS